MSRPVLIFSPPEWMEGGRCAEVDPALFFAEFRGDKHARAAKRICSTCEVKDTCLEYALGVTPADDFGVWGGTTEAERDEIRAARGITTVDLTDGFDLRAFVRKPTPVVPDEFAVDERAEEDALDAQIAFELAAA